MKKKRDYGAVAPWARPQVEQEVETSAPARAADLVADLVVPLGQSVVTGVFLAGLFVVLLKEAAPHFDGDLRKLFGMAALAIAAVVWLLLLVDTRRLLWGIERITGMDLDGDRAVGKPGERVVIVNAERSRDQVAQQDNAQRASEFARWVAQLDVRGTDARTWEGEMGRDRYQEYRDALIRLGWARWNSTQRDGKPNKKQGWVLMVPARDILRRISG